jgi:hypothetical protein
MHDKSKKSIWRVLQREYFSIGKGKSLHRCLATIFRKTIICLFLSILLWSMEIIYGYKILINCSAQWFMWMMQFYIFICIFVVQAYFNKEPDESWLCRMWFWIIYLPPLIFIFIFSFYAEININLGQETWFLSLISESLATVMVVITIVFSYRIDIKHPDKTNLLNTRKIYSIDAFCLMLFCLILSILLTIANNIACLCATLSVTFLFSYLILHYYFGIICQKR